MRLPVIIINDCWEYIIEVVYTLPMQVFLVEIASVEIVLMLPGMSFLIWATSYPS